VGGPYGNPWALRAFVADARSRGCGRLFCLGDLGGFGADVDGLWPVLVDNGIECIAGNYDVAISRGDQDCGCGYRDPRDNEYAQLIYDHTLAHTSRGFAAWMGRLPTEHRERIGGYDVHFVHGSPLGLNDFWWELLPAAEHRRRAGASGADVVLCTHSGLAWQQQIGDTLAVNVGVLGKPANDGRTEVWYAILDLDGPHARAELVALAYDWCAQAGSMRLAGLPELLWKPSKPVTGRRAWRSCRRPNAPAGSSTSTAVHCPPASNRRPGGGAALQPWPGCCASSASPSRTSRCGRC